MKHVILLSGGLDSATLLAYLRSDIEDVPARNITALSFDYGQKHKIELQYAKALADYYRVAHEIIKLPAGIFRSGALVGDGKIPEKNYDDETQRQTVVPGRNLVFVSIAASIAAHLNHDAIYIAAHAGDSFIYPDCRSEFIKSLDATLSLFDYRSISLRTPFIQLTKPEIATFAIQLRVPIDLTYSCYFGGEKQCNKCGACLARIEALQIARLGLD